MDLFASISNEKLRKLVMEAPSIQRLPEKQKNDLIRNISLLPLVGQVELIGVLEQSKKEIDEIEAVRSQQERDLNTAYQKLVSIEKTLKNGMNAIRQQHVKSEDDQVAESLIQNL